MVLWAAAAGRGQRHGGRGLGTRRPTEVGREGAGRRGRDRKQPNRRAGGRGRRPDQAASQGHSRYRGASPARQANGAVEEATGPQRITKLMAKRGICSRREAERLIDAGLVLVDGVVVTEQGTKALPSAEIEVKETATKWLQDKVTIILNKPRGLVSNLPNAGETEACTLIKARNAWGNGDEAVTNGAVANARGLNVCGRLDKDSRGLLILTEDGLLAKAIIGGNGIEKRYVVKVDKEVQSSHLKRLNGRMILDGAQLLPMKVKMAEGGDSRRTLMFRLREGKKRQIRRVCSSIGLEVVDLLRTHVGSCTLGGLPEGCWRVLTPEETEELRRHHSAGRIAQ